MPPPALHAFPDSLVFARKLGRALGSPVERIVSHHFPDGESCVRVRATWGSPAIVVRSLDPNAKLVELLLVADALRRAGAASLTLVAPYLAYMRQDCVFTPGEPISQRVVGAVLGRASSASSPSKRGACRGARPASCNSFDSGGTPICTPIDSLLESPLGSRSASGQSRRPTGPGRTAMASMAPS